MAPARTSKTHEGVRWHPLTMTDPDVGRDLVACSHVARDDRRISPTRRNPHPACSTWASGEWTGWSGVARIGLSGIAWTLHRRRWRGANRHLAGMAPSSCEQVAAPALLASADSRKGISATRSSCRLPRKDASADKDRVRRYRHDRRFVLVLIALRRRRRAIKTKTNLRSWRYLRTRSLSAEASLRGKRQDERVAEIPLRLSADASSAGAATCSHELGAIPARCRFAPRQRLR